MQDGKAEQQKPRTARQFWEPLARSMGNPHQQKLLVTGSGVWPEWVGTAPSVPSLSLGDFVALAAAIPASFSPGMECHMISSPPPAQVLLKKV